MKKEEIQTNLSKVFLQLRLKHGLSKAKMANRVFMTESTWNHYESGKSSPTVPEFIRIFSELNEDALQYVLKIVYPETYGNLTHESGSAELRQAAAYYITNVASDQTVRILDFIIFGNHGSNVESQIQEFCAYEHLPMQYKLAVACLIDSLYMMAEDRGELVATEHVMPNLELFRKGLMKGKAAAHNRKNSYTTSTE